MAETPTPAAEGSAPAETIDLARLMDAASASATPAPDATATATAADGDTSALPDATPSTDGQASPDAGRADDAADGTGAAAETAGAPTDTPLTQADVDRLLAEREKAIEAKWRARTNQERDRELNQLKADLARTKREADKALLANHRAGERARTEGLNYFDLQDVNRQAMEEVDAYYNAQDQQAQQATAAQQAAIAAKEAEFAGRIAKAREARAALKDTLWREALRNKVDVDDLDAIIDGKEIVADTRIKECVQIFSDPQATPAEAERAVRWMYERAGELATLDLRQRGVAAAKAALPTPRAFDRTQSHGSGSAVGAQLPALGTAADWLGQAMDAARQNAR